jgi:hypothetical protein
MAFMRTKICLMQKKSLVNKVILQEVNKGTLGEISGSHSDVWRWLSSGICGQIEIDEHFKS